MFTIDFPYDFGSFVKIIDRLFERKRPIEYGTIVSYTVAKDGIAVFVSGYKEPWCGEYMLEDVQLMTDGEVDELKRLRKEQGYTI